MLRRIVIASYFTPILCNIVKYEGIFRTPGFVKHSECDSYYDTPGKNEFFDNTLDLSGGVSCSDGITTDYPDTQAVKFGYLNSLSGKTVNCISSSFYKNGGSVTNVMMAEVRRYKEEVKEGTPAYSHIETLGTVEFESAPDTQTFFSITIPPTVWDDSLVLVTYLINAANVPSDGFRSLSATNIPGNPLEENTYLVKTCDISTNSPFMNLAFLGFTEKPLLLFGTSGIPGDMNQDQVLNIADVVQMVQHVVQALDCNPMADYNQDSACNIIDVVALTQYIVNMP